MLEEILRHNPDIICLQVSINNLLILHVDKVFIDCCRTYKLVR